MEMLMKSQDMDRAAFRIEGILEKANIRLVLKAHIPLYKTRVKIRNLYDKVFGAGAYDKIKVSKKSKESKAKVDINVAKDEAPEMMSAEAHERYSKAKKKLAAYTGTDTHYGSAIAARAEKKLKKKGKLKKGQDTPGERDGTGPYKGSWQRLHSNMGKRQEDGEECPVTKKKKKKKKDLQKARKGMFAHGTSARAKRNVYAEGMEDEGVDNPYAVATAMVKRGAKPRKKSTKKDVKAELKKQKRIKREKGW